jgi:hypothetical protein
MFITTFKSNVFILQIEFVVAEFKRLVLFSL